MSTFPLENTDICTYGTPPQTVEHVVQECNLPNKDTSKGKDRWPSEKYIQCTAIFVHGIGLPVGGSFDDEGETYCDIKHAE